MNIEPIKERLKQIDENLPILKELKVVPLDKFRDNKKLQLLAERCLQLNIQALLDIAHYIIAQQNWKRSSENKEAILTLGTKGVIPEGFASWPPYPEAYRKSSLYKIKNKVGQV